MTGKHSGGLGVTERPESEEQRAYLVRMFFGAEDETKGFIFRAYRDVSRTLHGLSKVENKEALKANARLALLKALRDLESQSVPLASNDLAARFDAWHRRACVSIIKAFTPSHCSDEKPQTFHCHYGQAQKWLNMTIKYRWFFARGTELGNWYAVAHVPVDEYVLSAAREHNVSRPAKAEWSRWDADDYNAFQREVRIYAAKHDMTPLALEHIWWMEEARSRDLKVAANKKDV
jgi:hypothetical protein